MAAKSGRKLRIKYSTDGTTYAAIAGARSDSFTVANEMIAITDKDDAGIRTLLDDIGSQAISLAVEGVLTEDTFIDLAVNAGEGSAIHYFQVDVIGLGTLTGQWFIANFQSTGADGTDPTTFTCALESAGAIVWAAA